MKCSLFIRLIAVMIFVVAAGLLTGCSSRVPFTKALIKEYDLSSGDIRRLQFYISDPILLEQEVMMVGKNVEDSTYSLKTVEDHYIKRVIFKKKIPCVVTSVDADRLSVSFEPSDRITFVLDRSHPRGDVFCYRPEKKSTRAQTEDVQPARSGFAGWQFLGNETYSDSTYNVFVRRLPPYLIVDEASLKNLVVESRAVQGMRQSDLRQMGE